MRGCPRFSLSSSPPRRRLRRQKEEENTCLRTFFCTRETNDATTSLQKRAYSFSRIFPIQKSFCLIRYVRFLAHETQCLLLFLLFLLAATTTTTTVVRTKSALASFCSTRKNRSRRNSSFASNISAAKSKVLRVLLLFGRRR